MPNCNETASDANPWRPDTDAAQFAHELLALRYAHHWAHGFMRDPAALPRTRTAFERLIGRPQREPAAAGAR